MSHLTIWQNALAILFTYLVYKRRRPMSLNLYVVCINCLVVLMFSWQLQHVFAPPRAIYHLLLSMGCLFGVILAYLRVALAQLAITMDGLCLPANTQLSWLLIVGIMLLNTPTVITGFWLDTFDCLAMCALGGLAGWIVAKDVLYWLLMSSDRHMSN